MAKQLYVRSKSGDDSRLILSERPPLIFRLGAKLKAARLGQRPPQAVPAAADSPWASFLFNDPSDYTGLRLILKRVSGPRSAQVAVSCPRLPQQSNCCVPSYLDRARPGLGDGPVLQTENKTSTLNGDPFIGGFFNSSCGMPLWCRSRSCKRAASEMDDEELQNPSKGFYSDSSLSCFRWRDKELESDDDIYQ